MKILKKKIGTAFGTYQIFFPNKNSDNLVPHRNIIYIQSKEKFRKKTQSVENFREKTKNIKKVLRRNNNKKTHFEILCQIYAQNSANAIIKR